MGMTTYVNINPGTGKMPSEKKILKFIGEEWQEGDVFSNEHDDTGYCMAVNTKYEVDGIAGGCIDLSTKYPHLEVELIEEWNEDEYTYNRRVYVAGKETAANASATLTELFDHDGKSRNASIITAARNIARAPSTYPAWIIRETLTDLLKIMGEA